MSKAAIEIRSLEKHLGMFKLGPLSLNIPRGAIYGLIGPNGAGKTTTLDLLLGLTQPDNGELRLLGRELDLHEVEIKRRVAYVSPDLNYQAWGTVERAIAFVSGFYPDWNRDRCERLQFEFGVHKDEKIAALSFGARIKLALIMALSRDAELLVLDEPTVGLDAVSRRQLFAELLAFMRKEDRTILISSHQLTDLERFADHVAIMDQGRLLTAGRVDELLERHALLQVRSTRNEALSKPGLRVLKRDGDRFELLLDRQLMTRDSLATLGMEVIAETPLTLEDLFIALVGTPATKIAGAA
jgi:ABC-2 type transport system ATP-binding protein